MRRPNRRVFLVGLVLIAVTVLVLDPHQIANRLFSRRRPPVPRETVDAAIAVVEEHGRKPEELVLDLLSRRKVVFLAEFPQIAEHPAFLAGLIPHLPDHGVYTVGVDFARSEEQDLIDRVLRAPDYDEEAVHRILFHRLPSWGYEEYAEVFRAAWQANRRRPEKERVRIIGLDARRNRRPLQLPEEERPQGAELGRLVFPDGEPDRHMADRALAALRETGGPLLLYAGARHALAKLHDLAYVERMADLGFQDAERAGNLLEAELGEDITTVYLHGPWPHEGSRNGLTFAADGLIDALLDELPEDRRRVGFPVAGTPLADYPVERTDMAYGHGAVSFAEIADAYLVPAPTSSLTAATPIPEFITDEILEEARTNFPTRVPEGAEPTDLNAYIARVSNNLGAVLEGFK
ncbi:MAG: hypothetical protein ACLFRR_04395 [Spirochaetaceae bacterium]